MDDRPEHNLDSSASLRSFTSMRLGAFTGPLICGVDEAGRGPLAGPVVAAAVILSSDFDISGLDDSKRLSPVQREKQRDRIMASESIWGIGVVEPELIDKINILQATFTAMRYAINFLGIAPDLVLVDGNRKIPEMPYSQKTIIGGDGLEPSISAASIMAKTYRDDLMRNYSRQYPDYGFERHKGYATTQHLSNLYKFGPSPIHRKSFYPVSNYFLRLN